MAAYNKVMVIDDDELFLLVSKSIMEDEDFATDISTFEDGRESLDFMKSADDSMLPEIVFLDINMPMIDGWEFIDELKKLSLENRMKIYLTSSSINPLDLEKAKKHPNINGFISKPLMPDKLKEIADDKS